MRCLVTTPSLSIWHRAQTRTIRTFGSTHSQQSYSCLPLGREPTCRSVPSLPSCCTLQSLEDPLECRNRLLPAKVALQARNKYSTLDQGQFRPQLRHGPYTTCIIEFSPSQTNLDCFKIQYTQCELVFEYC